MTLTFHIHSPGEWEAGIRAFSDDVTVTVVSGEPGGDPGEFAKHLTEALGEWYDGAKVEQHVDGKCWTCSQPGMEEPHDLP